MNIYQFSQQGKRSNNEDSMGKTPVLLTVCDGMGGHVSGERASAFVVQAMTKAFAEPRPLGKMEIQQQLNQVQNELNQLLETEPELEKMGTTFTGVFITPDVWYAAHIGDSRIYLFRPSEQKLWHTWDHSLVGELMRTKEITVEAGRFHPMSNRISKAIIAQKDSKPASASIVKIDELKKDDILLLCSDGVVEGWGDWQLVQLFSAPNLSFEQKCEKLRQQCEEKSKDNNTAIIVEIEEKDAISYGHNEELEWTTFAEVEADYQQYVKDNEEVEEEAPKPAAPAIPQINEVTMRQEGKKPETPSMPKPQPRSVAATKPAPKSQKLSGKTEKKSINKLFPLLALFLLVAIIGVLMLLKSGKPAPIDADTKAYEACQTEDSIQTAQNEKNKADAPAVRDEVYPAGKPVKEVKDKKKQSEQQAQAKPATKDRTETEKKKKEEKEKAQQKEQEEVVKVETEAKTDEQPKKEQGMEAQLEQTTNDLNKKMSDNATTTEQKSGTPIQESQPIQKKKDGANIINSLTPENMQVLEQSTNQLGAKKNDTTTPGIGTKKE